MVGVYYQYAAYYREQTLMQLENLTTKLTGRYLLSLQMIYNLYQMVFDRIDIGNGRFTTSELNPTPSEIREKVLEISSGWKSLS